MAFRKEKLASLLERIFREFIFFHFPHENNGITVTRIDLASDFKKAVIFVTIEPEEKSEKTLEKLKNLLPALRKTVAEKLTIKFIPAFECKIDMGEKNRARIEELIKKLAIESKKRKR